MRIISDFHDYYDTIQAQGQDLTTLYVRKQQKITIKNWPFPAIQYHNRWIKGHWQNLPNTQQHIVGFCGKIYPIWKMTWGHHKPALCHTSTEVDTFIRTKAKTAELEEYETGRKKRTPEKYWSRALRKHKIEEYFDKCKSQQTNFNKIFIEHHCPIFIAEYKYKHDSTITINGNLKEIEFYRLFDTQTAFQEIAMYFGNLTTPPKPIPKIDDKTMTTSKGFDKWSFRKEPH